MILAPDEDLPVIPQQHSPDLASNITLWRQVRAPTFSKCSICWVLLFISFSPSVNRAGQIQRRSNPRILSYDDAGWNCYRSGGLDRGGPWQRCDEPPCLSLQRWFAATRGFCVLAARHFPPAHLSQNTERTEFQKRQRTQHRCQERSGQRQGNGRQRQRKI